MKLRLKKILITILVMCVCVSNFPLITHAMSSNDNIYINSINEIISKDTQKKVLDDKEDVYLLDKAYTNIMTYMENENDHPNSLSQYFGNMYIDNNQTLVIYLLENANYDIENIKCIAEYDNVIIKKAEFSYNELFTLKSEISEKIKLLKNQVFYYDDQFLNIMLDSFVGIGIDDTNNSLSVDFTNLDNEKIQTFKKYVYDSSAIYFNNVDEAMSENAATKYYPGEKIYVYNFESSSYRICSMGFRAWRLRADGSYIYGFVTTGHAGDAGDPVLFTNLLVDSALIGNIVISQQSETIDAAFVGVETDRIDLQPFAYYSDDDGDTTGKDELDTSVYFTSVSTGRDVVKNGGTTYRTTGEVKSSSYDAVLVSSDGSERTISDCIKANYKSDNGDSGGIVYGLWDEDDSEYMVIGIHAGSNSGFLGIGRISTIIKISNIQDELRVYYY
ncbi:MAG: hypothetical protein IJZ83_08215 [Clostridia bacterium]|nr:hypothetical protein [Clostridia bacterium]